MFATTLLANDMGGFALAQQLANDPQAGLFAGGNLRCNDGTNVSLYNSSSAWHYPKRRPTILSNRCFERDYYNSFGLLACGLTAGMPLSLIIPNLIPIIIVAA